VGRSVNYSIPKRKATLSPSERPRKFARTDTPRRPEIPSVGHQAPSSSLHVPGSSPSVASPTGTKNGKKKIVLTRSGELSHSLRKLPLPSFSTSSCFVNEVYIVYCRQVTACRLGHALQIPTQKVSPLLASSHLLFHCKADTENGLFSVKSFK